MPECAYTAGKLIVADLEQHDDEHYRQIGTLMHWLFSCSGNSSVDFDDESLAEFQPLSWQAEEIAFAVEIIEKAEWVIHDAMAGIEILKAAPDLMAILDSNAQMFYSHLAR